VPDNNKRRKQIAELEEAGRTKDIQWVSAILDMLYPENRESLGERWARRYPKFPLPTSSSLKTEQAESICESLASVCRDGGRYVDGHLRKGGRRSREWKTELHAPPADRNIEKVTAEEELVRNLALTWLQITGDPPPDTVHKDLSVPFAKFVQRVFELLSATGSVFRRINEHGERRRLPIFVEAAIWRWQNPVAEWSSMPADLGDWKLVKNRFDRWPERAFGETLFREMQRTGRSAVAIQGQIIDMIDRADAQRSSSQKKAQRARKGARGSR
jgi:hypothetical protein